MNARLRPLTRTVRQARGFTLVETVVASALSALAVLAVLAVLVQLTGASASTLSRAELARQVTQLDTQLNRDIATAVPCRAHRAGSIVRTGQPNRVAWTADPDGDGVTELITWAFSGGQLLRSTTPDAGNCDFISERAGTATAVSVVLDGLAANGPDATTDTPDLPGYAVYLVAPDVAPGVADQVDELGDDVGRSAVGASVVPVDCTADPTGCLQFTGLRMSVTATTADNVTVTIDRTLAYPDDRSRLTAIND